MVMEYMAGGTLFELIHENRGSNLNWKKKFTKAIEVSEAMVFLHESKISHLDLNSKNILIDSLGRAKISDLGLSVETDKKYVSKRVGTVRWMAPEVHTRTCTFPEKSDVWSFGVVMFELGTELIPYHDKVDEDVLYEIKYGRGPEIPRDVNLKKVPQWESLMKSCWSTDISERPTFRTLHKALVRARQKLNLD